MEDYGFEYSDEEPEEQDVDIENQYYNSKGIRVLVLVVSFIGLHPVSKDEESSVLLIPQHTKLPVVLT